MTKYVTVFIPNYLLKQVVKEECFILGVAIEDEILGCTNFIVHDIVKKNIVLGLQTKIIGYCKIKGKDYNEFPREALDLIVLEIKFSEPELVQVICKSDFFEIGKCSIIIYDNNLFSESEFLLSPIEYFRNRSTFDYFKAVSTSLKDRQLPEKGSENGSFDSTIYKCVPFVIFMINLVVSSTNLEYLTKISTLAEHCFCYINNLKWALKEFMLKKRLTLKLKNYFLGLVTDWCCGVLVMYLFIHYFTMNDLYDKVANNSEKLVKSLTNMVHYLMGSPADLKLNHPLNNVLGKFFLYHIDLWWSFLSALRPVLEFSFKVFISTGFCGLSFQIAILADLLVIANCHVYCIYVYAARLYNLQITGLISLSRLFIGRNRNPLPGRVDSCPYTTEQLFMGTIAFTVLFFLLPTTLVYYIVFTVIRLFLITFGGVLTRVRHILQILPLYVTLLWCLNSKITTSSIILKPRLSNRGQLLLFMTPQQSSWLQLTKACIPDTVKPLPPVEWSVLMQKLVNGKLIYPL